MLKFNSKCLLEEYAGRIVKASEGAQDAAEWIEDLVGEGELPEIPRTGDLLQTKLAFLRLLANEIADELVDLSQAHYQQNTAR